MNIIKCAVNIGVDALLIQPGLAKRAIDLYKGRCGLIVRIGAATALGPDPGYEINHISVEDALSLGANGVCITTSLGSKNEPGMLQDIGRISMDCERPGVPFIAEMILDGSRVGDIYVKEYIA